MISMGLVLGLAAEVVAFVVVAVAVWPWSVGGVPVGSVAVACALVVLFVRLAAVPAQFIVARVRSAPREPQERIGLVQGIFLVVRESLSFMLVLCLLMPFARRLVALRRGTVSSPKQYPVLLIHGYSVNAGVWVPMLEYLWARGLTNVFTMSLHPRFGDIDDYAQQVAARVHRICSTTRARKVILVGHSMGGLVARAYVERCGGASRVAKVITIATPHHGTVLARTAPGVCGSQMRIGSDWLQDLNRDENVAHSVRYVSVYSAHDNIVVPHTSAELGKARNIQLVGKGHFDLLFARQVGQLVYREVMEAQSAAA